jgi:hypothetical protein
LEFETLEFETLEFGIIFRWCATAVDEDGVMLEDRFGLCNCSDDDDDGDDGDNSGNPIFN